jgi:protein-S-isoprenylcysteine O-methyltransferase Ste14
MHLNIHTIITIIWVCSEILLNRLFRSAQTDKQHADKQSLRIIWITIAIALPTAQYLKHVVDLPISHSSGLHNIGSAMIVAGMIFRFIAVYTLGRYFTVDVAIRSDHRIVKRGMYQYLRHPSYLGSLISFLGNGFALNNWIGLAVSFIPVLLAFMYRMKVEEELLVANFGQAYLDYKKETKKLLPFVY